MVMIMYGICIASVKAQLTHGAGYLGNRFAIKMDIAKLTGVLPFLRPVRLLANILDFRGHISLALLASLHVVTPLRLSILFFQTLLITQLQTIHDFVGRLLIAGLSDELAVQAGLLLSLNRFGVCGLHLC